MFLGTFLVVTLSYISPFFLLFDSFGSGISPLFSNDPLFISIMSLCFQWKKSLRMTHSSTQLGLLCISVQTFSFLRPLPFWWTCHWAFTGPISQQCKLCKNRLLTSIKLRLVMLLYCRLMVIIWNNVMPPTRRACSTFMNACGVTDVVCYSGLHYPVYACFVCVIFMYLCMCAHGWFVWRFVMLPD